MRSLTLADIHVLGCEGDGRVRSEPLSRVKGCVESQIDELERTSDPESPTLGVQEESVLETLRLTPQGPLAVLSRLLLRQKSMTPEVTYIRW